MKSKKNYTYVIMYRYFSNVMLLCATSSIREAKNSYKYFIENGIYSSNNITVSRWVDGKEDFTFNGF